MDYLKDHYLTHNEDERLVSKMGHVEYITTMEYITRIIPTNAKILEVGAATGRYSLALAEIGHDVTAMDILEHHVNVMSQKKRDIYKFKAIQGNATDLSQFDNNVFDAVLILGPMYHLLTKDERRKALQEAVRVTKPGGYIFVAYCMTDPTIIHYVFEKGNLQREKARGMLTRNWDILSDPEDVFVVVRTDDINSLNEGLPAKRVRLIATDGAAKYLTDAIEAMDDATFDAFMDYHLTTCERGDIIGSSPHVLDILQKTI